MIHKTASPGDPSAEDIARSFQNDKAGMKSVHYVVGLDGEIVQCVSEKDGAGGNGLLDPGHDSFWDHTGVSNPNLCTISIEHVDSDPNNGTPLTSAQKAASFALIGDICKRNNIPPERIFEHRSLQPINRVRCPGNYPMDELRQHVATVLAEGVGVSQSGSDHGITLTASNAATSSPTDSPTEVGATKLVQALIQGRLESDAVQEQATADIPVQSLDKDKLGFGVYVRALRDFIASPDTSTPLTIGIYGAWGSGKSSLMRMVENQLNPSLDFWCWLWLKWLWWKWFGSFIWSLLPWLFGKLMIWIDDRRGSAEKFQDIQTDRADSTTKGSVGGNQSGRLNNSGTSTVNNARNSGNSKPDDPNALDKFDNTQDNQPNDSHTIDKTGGPKRFQEIREKLKYIPRATDKDEEVTRAQKIRAGLSYDPSTTDIKLDNLADPIERRWAKAAARHCPMIPPTHPTIWFNAWKFDQEEQLWAALALEVLDQIKRRYNIFQRIIFWFRLMLKRFSLTALWSVIQTVSLPLLFGLIYWLYISYMKQLPHLPPLQVFGFQIQLGQLLLGAGIAVSALIQVLKIAKDPFQLQMKNVFDKPNYKDKVGFIGSLYGGSVTG